VCQDNFEPITVECRADAGDCDVPEFCDAAGACPANGFEPDGTTCTYGDLCTTDACVSGACVGTPVVCNDQNSCTNDVCDPEDGVCDFTNNGSCLSGATLAPTQTTCERYRDNIAPTTYYDQFNYVTKRTLISGVSPGVVFYYNTITSPGGDITLVVEETNSGAGSIAWKDMLIQQNKGKLQAYLYDYNNCKTLQTLTKDSLNTAPYSVTFDVDGTTVNQQFIIGIKYSASSLVGQKPDGVSRMYNFQTFIDGTGGAISSWPVEPK